MLLGCKLFSVQSLAQFVIEWIKEAKFSRYSLTDCFFGAVSPLSTSINISSCYHLGAVLASNNLISHSYTNSLYCTEALHLRKQDSQTPLRSWSSTERKGKSADHELQLRLSGGRDQVRPCSREVLQRFLSVG
jgi:hypothetical protein